MERSHFDGTILQHFGYSLLAGMFTAITFGIGAPWAYCGLHRWEANHTVIESKRLEFSGTGLQLFLLCLKLIFLPIFIIIGAALILRIFVETKIGTVVGGFMLFALLILFIFYGSFAFIQFKKWIVGHTSFQVHVFSNIPESVPQASQVYSQPIAVEQKRFPLKSKDLVKAEGMITYCEWFHFESGVSKPLYKKLFEKAESSVSPDKEVVMTFMALGDYKSQMENGGPCACVMSATKFIVAFDREVITIPITDIDGFSVVSGSPMSVITMSHRYGELKLGVENSTLPLLLNFCNEALSDCKKEIEELSVK